MQAGLLLSLAGLDLSAAGSRAAVSVMTIVTWWLSKSLSIPGDGKLHYCSTASYQVALVGVIPGGVGALGLRRSFTCVLVFDSSLFSQLEGLRTHIRKQSVFTHVRLS